MSRIQMLLRYTGAVLLVLLVTGLDCDRDETTEPEEEIWSERTWVRLTPEAIDFGAVTVGLSDTDTIQSIRETISSDHLPHRYHVAVDGDFPDFHFVADAGAESLITDTVTATDPTSDFRLVFAPLDVGIYSSRAISRGMDGGVHDAVQLDGIGVEGCAFSRNRIDFGDVDVGTSRQDTFTVRNITVPPGQHDVTIRVEIVGCEFLKFVTNGNPAYDHIETTLSPGAAAVCTLQFTPPGAGDYNCSLDTQDESYCGPVFVTGTGAGASLGDWETCLTDRGPDLYGVHGNFHGKVFAVGDSALVVSHGEHVSTCVLSIRRDYDADTLSLRAVWVDDSYEAWIAGSEIGGAWGGAYVLNERGSGLVTRDMVLTVENYNCGWASSETDIYFFGLGVASDHNGRHFDGSDWSNSLIDFGMSEVTGVWGSGPEDMWAVMNLSSNNVWRYDGTSWQDMSPAWVDEYLKDVWVDRGGDVFVVGDNGAIYHYDGSGWEDQSVGGSGTLYGVSGSSPGDVHAVGSDAALYHYDGFTWRRYTPPAGITVDLYDVWVHHDGEAWAVGQRTTILYHHGR